MQIKRYNKRNGWTLVELLVVMAIIAFLAILGGANYITSIRRGRDATRRSDLEQIRAGLEMYRTDFGAYPISSAPNTQDDVEANYVAMRSLLTTNNYLNQELQDPLGGRSYEYDSDGMTYEVCARLEMNPPGNCGITHAAGASDGDYGVLNP